MMLLTGCGSMFDFTGRGTIDRKIYYDVKTNMIINTYSTPINSFYLRKYKNDSTYFTEVVELDKPLYKFSLPILRDSLAYYDFGLSIHMLHDHWRMMHHLDITKEGVVNKEKIFSRFTSH